MEGSRPRSGHPSHRRACLRVSRPQRRRENDNHKNARRPYPPDFRYFLWELTMDSTFCPHPVDHAIIPFTHMGALQFVWELVVLKQPLGRAGEHVNRPINASLSLQYRTISSHF